MITTRHNPYINAVFKLYIKRKLKSHFAQLKMQTDAKPKRSILLISNHFSWWDGFFAFYLSWFVFQKKFHFMMLESELNKHWYFKQIGGFPMRPNSRESLESLAYTSKLLQEEENLVLVFPQGKIYSAYTTEFSFQKGVERIVATADCDILLNYNLIDYLNTPKPTAYLHTKIWKGENLAADYNRFANQILCEQKRLNI